MILNRHTALALGVLFCVLVVVRVGYTIARRRGTLEAESKSDRSVIKGVIELVDAFLVALVLVFAVIKPFIVQTFFIPSPSMVPTLQVGDRLLVNKFVYHLKPVKRGDIVVFRAPPEAIRSPQEVDFIKRVIGLPGDRVEVIGRKYIPGQGAIGGTTYVNGQPLKEPYILAPPEYDFDTRMLTPDGRVPPGKLLVMGDNRNNSNDGHVWGFLDQKRLVGKAMCIFWPLSHMTLLRTPDYGEVGATSRLQPEPAVP